MPSSPLAMPSTTRNPALHCCSLIPPSFAISIPGGAAAWVADRGRRRDLGAPSQEANRCSPSGVSQMADIKKKVEGRDRGRWKHPPGWAGHRVLHISSHSLFSCLAKKRGFSSFFLPVMGFYKFCSSIWGQWMTFLHSCYCFTPSGFGKEVPKLQCCVGGTQTNNYLEAATVAWQIHIFKTVDCMETTRFYFHFGHS